MESLKLRFQSDSEGGVLAFCRGLESLHPPNELVTDVSTSISSLVLEIREHIEAFQNDGIVDKRVLKNMLLGYVEKLKKARELISHESKIASPGENMLVKSLFGDSGPQKTELQMTFEAVEGICSNMRGILSTVVSKKIKTVDGLSKKLDKPEALEETLNGLFGKVAERREENQPVGLLSFEDYTKEIRSRIGGEEL